MSYRTYVRYLIYRFRDFFGQAPNNTSHTRFGMTKLSFVIGEFISGWSHEVWMKIIPCGSL